MPRFVATNISLGVTPAQLTEALSDQLVLEGVAIDEQTLRAASDGSGTLEVEFDIPEDEADLIRGSMGQGRAVYIGRVMELKFVELGVHVRQAAARESRNRMLGQLTDHLDSPKAMRSKSREWNEASSVTTEDILCRAKAANSLAHLGSADLFSVPPVATQPKQTSEDLSRLSEVVLECVHADGVDVASLPSAARALVFQVGSAGDARLCEQVGRQHQPQLFERLVPNRELLTCISRSHFEIAWVPPGTMPMLKKLSKSPLYLENRLLQPYESEVLLPHGTSIGFSAFNSSERCFLVFRIALRTIGDVKLEGVHPAAQQAHTNPTMSAAWATTQMPLSTSICSASKAVTGVLECVHASGMNLVNCPENARVIPLYFGETMEVGRLHQASVFEKLLAAEPQWLSFVSRAHCRVEVQLVENGCDDHQSTFTVGDIVEYWSSSLNNWILATVVNAHPDATYDLDCKPAVPRDRIRRRDPTLSMATTTSTDASSSGSSFRPAMSKNSLRVENMSNNYILVSGRPLGKGQGVATIAEGGTLTFLAVRAQGAPETKFLEFVFRRARAVR